MAYTTELMSFAVKVGKEERANEWMRILVQRQAECVATLDRELMHFESIFRSEIGERIYLSWYSVQGKTGEQVKSSPFPIDKVHMAFWQECIDPSIPPIQYQHIVNFLPLSVAETIGARDIQLTQNAP